MNNSSAYVDSLSTFCDRITSIFSHLTDCKAPRRNLWSYLRDRQPQPLCPEAGFHIRSRFQVTKRSYGMQPDYTTQDLAPRTEYTQDPQNTRPHFLSHAPIELHGCKLCRNFIKAQGLSISHRSKSIVIPFFSTYRW